MSLPALRPVLDGLPQPTILVGPPRQVLLLNAAARALFPTASEGGDLVHVLRQPDCLGAVDAALQEAPGKAASRQIDLTIQKPVETRFRATISPIAAAEGRPVALLSLQDVSGQHSAERMRSTFVANVSHELRSPLTALGGFIETLQTGARNDPAAQDRFLKIMAAEAGRMQRLIDDLLSLSRVEEEKRLRPRTPVDLPALVEQASNSLKGLAGKRHVALRTQIEPGFDPHPPGDPDQLVQVFVNLIENAIKYGAPDSTVRLHIAPHPPLPGLGAPLVGVSVSDSGPGIAREHLPRLTERFYRIDDSRSRSLGGTGLGLSIVKHILERHRGRLLIESTPGKGSTFRAVLPLEAQG